MKYGRWFGFALVVSALAWSGGVSRADDDDIFRTSSVEPNVVILIDTSGSMNSPLSKGGSTTKLAIAKSVVTDVLSRVSGVRFGVFRFNNSEDGAELVAEIGMDTATMIDLVNDLEANGSTPLGRATRDVQDYFLGQFEVPGTSSGKKDKDKDKDSGASGSGGSGGSADDGPVVLASPIEYACQQNYVIVVTDGMPNGEAVDLVATTALSMYQSDHSTAFAGVQNVNVHTVGFDVPDGRVLLQQTADNGGGEFYTADSGVQLAAALTDIVGNVIENSFTFASSLVPSTSADGGNRAFIGSFEPSMTSPLWNGQLRAYNRGSSGTVPSDSSGRPLDSALAWEAGALLASRTAASRTIYTVVGNARYSFHTATAQITKALLGVATDAARADVINFIRGTDAYDHDADGSKIDERPWKLADIYHSSPALVRPPPLISADSSYADFKRNNASRTTILLVGANDGMLHAFRASDGYEMWAFVPPNQLPRLSLLGKLVGDHPYFVDSTPVINDVKIGDTWKTVAIFGLRRGGSAYYAIDVTDTTNPQYLWSFTDAELGETWSVPALGQVVMDGGTERSVAFFGGGYNTAQNNASGRAFYVVDLRDGSLLWKYNYAAATDRRYMNFSLPSSPTAVDLDGDGQIERVYIGDVGGQLWKFDVGVPAILVAGKVSNWTGKRLFVADTAQANPPAAGAFYPSQGFYGRPAIAYDDYGSLWVFVGSGDRNHPKASSSNYLFGIKDVTDMANGDAFDRTDLVSATSADEPTSGWYRQLPTDERVLDGAEVFGEIVYFTTFQPVSTNACDASNGIAGLYGLAMRSGKPGIDWPNRRPTDDTSGSPSITVGGGIPSDPDVTIGESSDTIVVGTTDGEVAELELPSTRTKRVRYWREVF